MYLWNFNIRNIILLKIVLFNFHKIKFIMKNRVIPVFIFIILAVLFRVSDAQQSKYYICKTGEGNRIMLEDHYTRNINYSDTGTAYNDEETYFTNILKKLGIYSEYKTIYFFDRKLSEFEKFTNINIGNNFYISAPEDIYYKRAIGFEINFDNIIGGGNLFHIVLDNEGINNLQEYSNYFIASPGNHLGKLDTTGVKNKSLTDKFKKMISKLIPKKRGLDEYYNSEPEFKVFIGSFVDDITMQMRARTQYLVSFVYRTGFDKFTSGIFIYDDSELKLNELSNLQVDNFYYSKVTGVIEDKSNNRYKVLVESGYYEGSGLELYEYNGTDFTSVANGFSFGI